MLYAFSAYLGMAICIVLRSGKAQVTRAASVPDGAAVLPLVLLSVSWKEEKQVFEYLHYMPPRPRRQRQAMEVLV